MAYDPDAEIWMGSVTGRYARQDMVHPDAGRNIAEAWAAGYREQRLKTPHAVICNGKAGDWEGKGCPAGPYCECWCHL